MHIQMKHLNNIISETPETRHRWRARPTLWGTAVASKRRSSAVESEDGGKRAAHRGGERKDGVGARRNGRHGPCRNPRCCRLDCEWWRLRQAAPTVEAVAAVRWVRPPATRYLP